MTNYPERVIAWLNLADAQWGLDEKPKAKKSYLKYTSLMKEQKNIYQKYLKGYLTELNSFIKEISFKD